MPVACGSASFTLVLREDVRRQPSLKCKMNVGLHDAGYTNLAANRIIANLQSLSWFQYHRPKRSWGASFQKMILNK
jgi:hypothetical protein